MDFLKDILGEELFKQVQEAVNAHNGNEANKDKQVKLANLAEGGYVSKDKYSALETTLGSKNDELTNANTLIEQLKKATKSDEGLQSKIADYESKVQQLQSELEATKLNSAIKVALLEAHANDIDYLTYKLNEKGEKLELDENGNIKGWSDKISSLKTQFPTQFEGSQEKKIDENKLDTTQESGTLTRADILKKPYAERLKIYEDDPKAYNEIMNK